MNTMIQDPRLEPEKMATNHPLNQHRFHSSMALNRFSEFNASSMPFIISCSKLQYVPKVSNSPINDTWHFDWHN